MFLPDVDTVKQIHEIILDVSGGKRGVHDLKLIVSAVERPKTFVEYIDAYDIDTISALLIDGIARYHGFRDGNKRWWQFLPTALTEFISKRLKI